MDSFKSVLSAFFHSKVFFQSGSVTVFDALGTSGGSAKVKGEDTPGYSLASSTLKHNLMSCLAF